MPQKRLKETEWLSSDDSDEMLYSRRQFVNEHPRKARLFAVACCERIMHLLTDKRSRDAVALAARMAEKPVSGSKLLKTGLAASAAHDDAFRQFGKVRACAEWAAEYVLHPQPFFAATRASNFAYVAIQGNVGAGPERAAQAQLLRDIFRNPFQPRTIDPAWITWKARRLAKKIYKAKSFDRLPELADVLQAAGSNDSAILDHCRVNGPHVRGCWVVDLVLGIE